MYQKLNTIFINKIQNTIEGKEADIKSIIKLINNQSVKSFKNPFSNLFLKNSLLSPNFKTTSNHKRKMYKKYHSHKKIKRHLDLSEYIHLYNNDINLLDEEKIKMNNIPKHNINNKLNNLNNINNYNEEIFFKNIRNRLYKSKTNSEKSKSILSNIISNSHKIRKNENNRLLNNEKFEIKNKKINKIKKINSTNNCIPKNTKYKNKTIQTTRILLPNKENNEMNKFKINHHIKKNNFVFGGEEKNRENAISYYNINSINNINTERINDSKFFQYMKKNEINLYNKINDNYNNKKNFDYNIKNYEEKRNRINNSLYLLDKSKLINMNKNKEEEVIIKEYNDRSNKYKNRCINIFTLLSLIKK